jgi:hypothetical protein
MNIEKLEELPHRETKVEYLTRKIGSFWNRKRHYSKIKDIYVIADRVCTIYIGKKWDDAFSYYCKLVPKNTEDRYEAFCYRFNLKRRYAYNSQRWFVEDGIIVHKPYTRPKTIKIRSLDYKSEFLNKDTKRPLPEFYWMSNKHKYTKKYIDENYAYFITQGWEKTYSSRNDPEYKRLYKEQQDRKRKNQRIIDKQKEERQYEMLSQSDKKILEEKERNSIVIQKHGFDEITSFRKEKQNDK